VTSFDHLPHLADIATETVDQVVARRVDEAEPVGLPDESTAAVTVPVDEL
jgi:hypothetical protein